MARVVRSVAGFRKELNIGDIFWHMTSLYGVPYEIVGPCTISAFLMDRRFGFSMVEYTHSRAGVEVTQEDSIEDLTNQHHGVFLNSADAYEYFQARTGKD